MQGCAMGDEVKNEGGSQECSEENRRKRNAIECR